MKIKMLIVISLFLFAGCNFQPASRSAGRSSTTSGSTKPASQNTATSKSKPINTSHNPWKYYNKKSKK